MGTLLLVAGALVLLATHKAARRVVGHDRFAGAGPWTGAAGTLLALAGLASFGIEETGVRTAVAVVALALGGALCVAGAVVGHAGLEEDGPTHTRDAARS